MHILMTGAAGMIGRKLTARLVKDGKLNGKPIDRLTLIDVVPPEKFAAWIASKGGTMPGATPAVAPAGEAATVTPAAAPAEAQPGAPTPSAADRATAND